MVAKSKDIDSIRTWRKRIAAAKELRKEWENENRVKDCYNFWKGNQLINEFDQFGNRKAQVNKIHPEVRNAIPSLYYYRPFARVTAQPELADTAGTAIDDSMQLLQDTANHLIRTPTTRFQESTLLALKESFWSMGVVEVGYSADFVDDPQANSRPPLKEDEDTKISKPVSEVDIEAMVAKEKQSMTERFYIRHIPSKQVLISISDKPIVEDNDWIGYWEDLPLEDVKASGAYENT